VVKQEIEILKAVGSHPNIVQLIDHWEDATRHYLVLQLCEGGDLFSQIVEHGKYSEKDAVKCCRQLAEALKHIHACGITHRSVGNLLLPFVHV
jgi:serine/threonine protein kinase